MNPDPLCHACSSPLIEGEKFCRGCGRPIAQTQHDSPDSPPSVPALTKQCDGCGAPLESGARFCRGCGRSLPPGHHTPASPTIVTPIPNAPDALPPANSEPNNKGRRTGVVALAVLILALAATGGVFAALQLTKSNSGTSAKAAPPKSTGKTRASTAPSRPIAEEIAVRVRRDIQPLQNELNLELRGLKYQATPMRAAVLAASKLERQLLQLQGWAATGARPRTAEDRAVLKVFRQTLSQHAVYANYIAGISPASLELPSWVVTKAIARADAARNSYFRLHGAAPIIPVVSLPIGVHEHLRSLVTRPQPAVTTPAPTTTTPAPTVAPNTSSDAAAISNVLVSHWQAINNGDYYGAYAFFSPNFQRRATAAGWVRDKNIDRPQSSPISVRGVSVSGNSATAYVSFSTRGSETSAGNTGCNRWNGSYTLVKSSGSWYIDSSHLTRISLDCATYGG